MGHEGVITLTELSLDEVQILMALDRRPGTAMEVANELDLPPAVITMYLRRLQAVGMVEACEQRLLGNQIQTVYALAPDSRVRIQASGGASMKLLQFCSVLTRDIREHMDDKAPPGSFTAGLTIAHIPPARVPELMHFISQLITQAEALEDKEQSGSIGLAIALYPRVDSQVQPRKGE